MCDESKNQIPPRTPKEFHFRSTSSKIDVSSMRPDSEASSAKNEQIDDILLAQMSGEAAEIDIDDETLMDPRNFLNGMYSNDNFLKLKSQIENEIIEQTK